MNNWARWGAKLSLVWLLGACADTSAQSEPAGGNASGGAVNMSRPQPDAGAAAAQKDPSTVDAGVDAAASPGAVEPEVMPADSGFDPPKTDTDAGTRGQTDGNYDISCAGLELRLRHCGLLGPGDYSCDEPASEADSCALTCKLIASCSILETTQCGGRMPAPLQQCLDGCKLKQAPFVCVSEGKQIDPSWVCDGRPDCLDRSDEAGCGLPGFACEDNTQTANAVQCDGAAQCKDGSDERGCKLFDCVASGEYIADKFTCDGHEHCLDGSDEHGCAQAICGKQSAASQSSMTRAHIQTPAPACARSWTHASWLRRASTPAPNRRAATPSAYTSVASTPAAATWKPRCAVPARCCRCNAASKRAWRKIPSPARPPCEKFAALRCATAASTAQTSSTK